MGVGKGLLRSRQAEDPRNGCRLLSRGRADCILQWAEAPRNARRSLGQGRTGGRLAADTPSKPGDNAVCEARFDGFLRFEIGVGCRKLEDALD